MKDLNKYEGKIVLIYPDTIGAVVGRCEKIEKGGDTYYIRLSKPRNVRVNVVPDPNGRVAVGVLFLPLYVKELEIETTKLVIGFPEKEVETRYIQETTSLAIAQPKVNPTQNLPKGTKQKGFDIFGG